jgi:glycine/D-amino acid oxidase-like deaminating enzyme
MERDGYLKSIWQDGQKYYQPSNTWKKDMVYDVAIIGGGITGLTTALLLQQQGKKCIIAEAHTIGHGTSLGTSAHLNTILDTSYAVIEKNFGSNAAKQIATASREAIDLIENIVNEHDIDCQLKYQTGYLFAQNDDEVQELESLKEAAERAGIVVNWSPQIPAPFSFKKACRIGFQAQLHIGKYLTGLAAAFEAAGGVILQHCVVSAVKEAAYISAATSQGEVKATTLVYATEIPDDAHILQLRCTPYRSYVMACRLNNDQYPDGMVYDMKNPYSYFHTEEIDGIQYLIAGGFDQTTGHEADNETFFTQQEAFLRTHFDIASIAYKGTSTCYNTEDGLPYIGLLPGHDAIYTGTGYSGNGLVSGTLAGQMIADAIVGKDNPYADLLRPARIKPVTN